MRFTMACSGNCGRTVVIPEATFERLQAGDDIMIFCCICTIKLLPDCPEAAEIWAHMKISKYVM